MAVNTNMIKVAPNRYMDANKIELVCKNTGKYIQDQVKKADKAGKLHRLSGNNKTNAVIFFANGRVYLTSVSVDTIIKRIRKAEGDDFSKETQE